jgi:hypothetical protein
LPVIGTSGQVLWGGGTTYIKDEFAFIPQVYFTQQINEKWVLGFGAP